MILGLAALKHAERMHLCHVTEFGHVPDVRRNAHDANKTVGQNPAVSQASKLPEIPAASLRL